MQRTLLIALATAVVAAGIATTATVLLTDDKNESAALASPSPSASPVATTSVETASPSPGSTARPRSTAGGDATSSPEPTATSAATTRPGVKLRSAESIDCSKEPKFCSSSDEMLVVDDRKLSGLSEASDPASTSRPTVAQDSAVRDKDKKAIGNGGAVSSLHVEVLVSNSSKETFVFAKREIVLDIFKDGKLYDTFSTTGSGFEMTPGSKMRGTFDRPITEDGSYEWRSKVWYYAK